MAVKRKIVGNRSGADQAKIVYLESSSLDFIG
jgi:hypothetical protein